MQQWPLCILRQHALTPDGRPIPGIRLNVRIFCAHQQLARIFFDSRDRPHALNSTQSSFEGIQR